MTTPPANPPPGPDLPGPGPGDPQPPAAPYGTTPPAPPYGAPPPSAPYGTGPYPPVTGAPPPGPYPAPATQGSPAMAIVAFVLSLVGCVAITIPISAGLAIAALVRGRKRGGSGAGWAWAALVVNALWLALLVAFFAGPGKDNLVDGFRAAMSEDAPRDESGRVLEPSEIVVWNVREGDCVIDRQFLDGEEVTEVTYVTVTPCEDPHVVEAYHSVVLPDDTWPGEDQIDETAQRECRSSFKEFVGIRPGRSELVFAYYYPTDVSWDLHDDREIVCLVGEGTDTLTGTLRGARR